MIGRSASSIDRWLSPEFTMRARVLPVLLFLAALLPGAAGAHPHVWIDVQVRVLFDAEGRAVALEETWLFDDLYSVYATEGTDKDGDGEPDQAFLEAVMAENMKNLAAYGYFTEIKSGETPVKTDDATDMSTRMRDKRLEMAFRLPFETPVSVTDMPLGYAIFDPTYYIEMVHAEVPDPIVLDGAPAGCRAELKQPNPDPEQIVLAASLDRTETAGDTLGKFFAETVRVTCAE